MADVINQDKTTDPAAASPGRKRNGSHKPIVPNSFRLGYLVHDVSRMRRTLVDHHMRPEGITRSQWWVLANISRNGSDGIMSTELAKLLDVGKVTLGGLVGRLEIAGYVYRRTDKQDRRAKHIFITQAGYALIDRMRVIIERLNSGICRGMSPEEVEQVEHHLLQIKSTLRDMLAEDAIEGDEPITEIDD